MGELQIESGRQIVNFGRNVSFRPRFYYRPQSEAEVLQILERHARGKLRAIGSLHSWSDVPVEADGVIDMSRLDSVEVESSANGTVTVVAGAGCRIQDLLDRVHAVSGATLPTLGAIKKQTISGATSTGTHGSGRSSLSHYVDKVKVAVYDARTGKPRVVEWSGGPELLAARCGLGCMGIVLSVSLRAVPKYRVAETLRRRATLEEILAEEEQYPLQQFVLMPHLWAYYQYQRSIDASPVTIRARLRAWLYRAYKLVGVDVGFHLTLKLLVSLTGFFRWEGFVRWFYRRIVPLTVIQGWTVADDSEPALTIRHYLFIHTEIELFVPGKHLLLAAELVRRAIDVFAGTATGVPAPVEAVLRQAGLLDELLSLRGTYTHHYPIVFRRVLPDDTLVSMTGGVSMPYYTISLFTFRQPGPAFHAFARFFAVALTKLFDARLHWGKYFPLEYRDIAHLYPRLEEFRALCRATDPHGVFRNDYAYRVLGFPRTDQPAQPANERTTA